MSIGAGIVVGRDKEQDRKIADLERRVLELEDVADIGMGQEIEDERLSVIDENIAYLKAESSTIKTETSKKFRYKVRDWYRGQLC